MRCVCDRCGEHMRNVDVQANIFNVGYKPISDSKVEWRHLTLCKDCQEELRLEFYKRGLTYVPENEKGDI